MPSEELLTLDISDSSRILFQKVTRESKTFIDFRRQYKKDNEWLFTKKGLQLTSEQFHVFRLIVDKIDSQE